MALRLPSLSPVAWVTAEKITQQGLWLVLFAVLAPILGPTPYGLFSIVMVFVGFCEFVLSDGAVEALVTAEELDAPAIGTANLASVGLALAVGAGLFLLAPVIGLAFQDPQLKFLVWSLIPLPVLSLLAAVPTALLRRSLDYRLLAVRSIAGLAIGGLFGIALAIAGAGVWALALQVLAQRLAECVIAWWSVPQRLRFSWSIERFHEMRPVAINVFTARVMIFVGGQMPRLILGYVLGPSGLGLFVLANRFLDILVSTTVFPRMVVGRIELRDVPPGSPEFGRRFAGMVQDVALLAFPVMLGAAALIPDLFRLWLDQRWLPGTVATQLVLLGGLPLVFSYCLDAAFLAAKLSSVFRTMATVQTVSMVATVLCAAPFGLNATCLALAVRPWLVLPFFLITFGRECRLSVLQPLLRPLQSLLGAVIMGAILSLPLLRPLWLDEKVDFAALIVLGVIVYGAYAYRFSRSQLKAAVAGIVAHRP
jgi:O-antigen/teichoic acid export membrane protein